MSSTYPTAIMYICKSQSGVKLDKSNQKINIVNNTPMPVSLQVIVQTDRLTAPIVHNAEESHLSESPPFFGVKPQ